MLWYSLIFPFAAQNFQFVAAHNKLCPQHLRSSRSSLEQGFQHLFLKNLTFQKTRVWHSNPETAKRGKLYYFMCMLNYILQTINPAHHSHKV